METKNSKNQKSKVVILKKEKQEILENNSLEIYQFNVSLKGYKPKMWRRFLVEKDMLVSDFVYVILSLFNANGSHLFQLENNYKFNKPLDEKEVYTIKDPVYYEPNSGYEEKDARDYKLRDLKIDLETKMELWYDFGDDWLFDIKLEKELKRNKNIEYPTAIKGKGFGIVDDVGGPDGLMEMIETGEIESYFGLTSEEMKEFDIEVANEMLIDELDSFRKGYNGEY